MQNFIHHSPEGLALRAACQPSKTEKVSESLMITLAGILFTVCHHTPGLPLGWHNAPSWEGGDLVLHETVVLLLEIGGRC